MGRPTHWGHTFLSVAQRGVTQLFAGGEPLAAGEMGDLAGVLDRVAGVVGVGEQFKRLGFALRHRGERLVHVSQPLRIRVDAVARRLQPDQ